MTKPFSGSFPLTQGFGENPASYAQFGLKGHDGLDYGLPTGTEVLAPHSGKVIERASDPAGYGNYLKIENDKEGSVLAHLKDFNVNIGDTVSEGQLIAHSDNTGNSTGPHLHWGYYLFPRDRSNGYAGFIDQLPLLKGGSTTMVQVEDAKFQELVSKSTKYDAFVSAGYPDVASVNAKIKQLEDDLKACQNKPAGDLALQKKVDALVKASKDLGF